VNVCKTLKQIAFFDGCQQECPKLEKKYVCESANKECCIWSYDRCLAETKCCRQRNSSVVVFALEKNVKVSGEAEQCNSGVSAWISVVSEQCNSPQCLKSQCFEMSCCWL